MRHIILTSLLIVLSASITLAVETRDWKLHPAIVEIAVAPRDLYAVGDVQGDYDRLIALLAAGKLIAPSPAKPEAVEWKGGPAVLICTGNVIDGYSQSLPVIALFRALQTAADKAGGRVIVTLGSNEAEFLASNGPGTKTAAFNKELQLAGISTADVAAGKDSAGIGAWLHELPIAAKVGDWFFCHAGSTKHKKLATLSAELIKDITSGGFGAPLLADPKFILHASLAPHPWWEPTDLDSKLKSIQSKEQADEARMQRDRNKKGGGKDAAQAQQDEQNQKKQEADVRKQMLGEKNLRADIDALGAHHLVFGHYAGKVTFADKSVRDPGHIYTEFKGLVFLIDTGMSRSTGGNRAALLHVQSGQAQATVLYADGQTASLGM